MDAGHIKMLASSSIKVHGFACLTLACVFLFMCVKLVALRIRSYQLFRVMYLEWAGETRVYASCVTHIYYVYFFRN